MEYLLNLPISRLMVLVEDIMEMDEERKRAQEEAERTRRQSRRR